MVIVAQVLAADRPASSGTGSLTQEIIAPCAVWMRTLNVPREEVHHCILPSEGGYPGWVTMLHVSDVAEFSGCVSRHSRTKAVALHNEYMVLSSFAEQILT